MFAAVAKSIFGSANDRYVRGLGKYVDAVNGFEPNIHALTDEELRGQTERFRQRLANGDKLNDMLPGAFARCAKPPIGPSTSGIMTSSSSAARAPSWRIAEMEPAKEKPSSRPCPRI